MTYHDSEVVYLLVALEMHPPGGTSLRRNSEFKKPKMVQSSLDSHLILG